jgi:hypothetical protein
MASTKDGNARIPILVDEYAPVEDHLAGSAARCTAQTFAHQSTGGPLTGIYRRGQSPSAEDRSSSARSDDQHRKRRLSAEHG